MHKRASVQALLQGGPADGAIRPVECGPDGRPPALLLLGESGLVFVGSCDEPLPSDYQIYQLAPEPEPIEPIALWPCRYVETLRS